MNSDFFHGNVNGNLSFMVIWKFDVLILVIMQMFGLNEMLS